MKTREHITFIVNFNNRFMMTTFVGQTWLQNASSCGLGRRLGCSRFECQLLTLLNENKAINRPLDKCSPTKTWPMFVRLFVHEIQFRLWLLVSILIKTLNFKSLLSKAH